MSAKSSIYLEVEYIALHPSQLVSPPSLLIERKIVSLSRPAHPMNRNPFLGGPNPLLLPLEIMSATPTDPPSASAAKNGDAIATLCGLHRTAPPSHPPLPPSRQNYSQGGMAERVKIRWQAAHSLLLPLIRSSSLFGVALTRLLIATMEREGGNLCLARRGGAA